MWNPFKKGVSGPKEPVALFSAEYARNIRPCRGNKFSALIDEHINNLNDKILDECSWGNTNTTYVVPVGIDRALLAVLLTNRGYKATPCQYSDNIYISWDSKNLQPEVARMPLAEN